jgi:hypothetical protein
MRRGHSGQRVRPSAEAPRRWSTNQRVSRSPPGGAGPSPPEQFQPLVTPDRASADSGEVQTRNITTPWRYCRAAPQLSTTRCSSNPIANTTGFSPSYAVLMRIRHRAAIWRMVLALLLGTVSAAATAQSLPSSEQRPAEAPVVRTSAELVRVDVVVVDRGGQAVPGLTAEDLSCARTARCTIEAVAFVRPTQSLAESRTPTSAGAVPAEQPDAAPAAPSVLRTIAIVVDDLGLSFTSVDRTQRTLGGSSTSIGSPRIWWPSSALGSPKVRCSSSPNRRVSTWRSTRSARIRSDARPSMRLHLSRRTPSRASGRSRPSRR